MEKSNIKILKDKNGLISSKLENMFILLIRRPFERSLKDRKQKNSPIIIKM
jgi:hypothetical protein